MHFDGTDGSTNFVEVTGKKVTPAGGAKIATAQSKFGGASGYFNGSDAALAVSTDPSLALGAGDFTWEAWIHLHMLHSTNYARYILYSDKADSAFGIVSLGNQATPAVYGFVAPGGIAAPAPLMLDTWHHVAVVRAGGEVKGFFDGAATGQAQVATALVQPAAVLYVGRSALSGVEFLNGYLDELRITKGLARYTAPFTPPAGPFPDP